MKYMTDMKSKNHNYEHPTIEFVEAVTLNPIAQSNLESPQDGGEWDWD